MHSPQRRQPLASRLPATVEAAPVGWRDLDEEGARGPDFAADRQSLHQPAQDDDDRSGKADGTVGGCKGQSHRARGDQDDGEQHRRSAAGAICKSADQHAAERAEDEADAERTQRKQQAGERCRCRKESLADIDGKEGVGREIVELQSIAQDSCNNDLLGERPAFEDGPVF